MSPNLLEKEQKRTRDNLSKYYKYVFICSSCKKKFGADNKAKGISKMCPICNPGIGSHTIFNRKS